MWRICMRERERERERERDDFNIQNVQKNRDEIKGRTSGG